MGWLRRLAASVWSLIEETVWALLHVAPPSVERNARMEVKLELSSGTTTVSPGWTTGCPLRPVA